MGAGRRSGAFALLDVLFPPALDKVMSTNEQHPQVEVTSDEEAMSLALDHAMRVRCDTSPNPWVGAIIVNDAGSVIGAGATSPAGGPHAEVHALTQAGSAAQGATLYCTLEPCSHHGRTPPCTDALIASGLRRVVVAIEDPDSRVKGTGIAALRDAGIDVTVGVADRHAREVLRPYLHHRSTGRPYVVLKSASTLDGRTSAADGTSRWITGSAARAEVHRLRAESDAVLVGAGTVRADDPSLTVREATGRDPLRVVLGAAPPQARVHPCLEWNGDIGELLDELGGRGCLQLLVEGGSRVARSFLDGGFVDRWLVYVAPAAMGGMSGTPLIGGPTVATMDELNRFRFVSAALVGDDVRLELCPKATCTAEDSTEGEH